MTPARNPFAYGDLSRHGRTDQVVPLLRRELAIALDLDGHLRRTSSALSGHVDPKVASLPRSLHRDLMARALRLAERLETLEPGSARIPESAKVHHKFWALFPDDSADPRAHLEALVAGYARFMRSTSDIAVAVKGLGDIDSAELLQDFSAVGNRGLWFLEIYLEGLALHMDVNSLPLWPGSASGVTPTV